MESTRIGIVLHSFESEEDDVTWQVDDDDRIVFSSLDVFFSLALADVAEDTVAVSFFELLDLFWLLDVEEDVTVPDAVTEEEVAN